MRNLSLLLVSLLALSACDRRTEPWVPIEKEPAPTGRPVRIPGLAKPTPRNAAQLSARRAVAPSAGEEIRGQVALADEVALPSGGVLFVIARAEGGGPPVAVKRLAAASFPVAFSLGPGDVMMSSRPLEGRLRISARLDVDGNPLTREPSGLSGEVSGTVEPGAADLEIVLRPAGG